MLEGLVERSIRSGKPPSHRNDWERELAGSPMPRALGYLWKAYNRLRRRVGSGGFGANPIAWGDIDAFTRHAQFRLMPWEIEIIEEIDDLYLKAQNSSQAE